uniref:SAP domain-containing protein n=1 Tax=Octopus bimaculoides TaxID=37653 RepID=A0A0L8HFD5_OCTBM
MSRFGIGTTKNPPWARQAPAEFITVTAATSLSSLSQPQATTALLHQPSAGVPKATVYSITTPTSAPIAQPQYAPQQLPPVGMQGQVLSQPAIAIPTSLATTTQVASVSYPPPVGSTRLAPAQQSLKQRFFTGTVTKIMDNFGFVDDDVFFQMNCCKGPLPKVADRVLVEATYNPNMPFKWNATRIQVLPNQSGTIRVPMSARRGTMGMRFDRDREREQRDKDREMRERERREQRRDKSLNKRPRSPNNHRSHSPSQRARSPKRRRNPRVVPRYVVQIPKLSLETKEANVMVLKSRYSNLYIPSDFFQANFTWTSAFPLYRPFQLGTDCAFHVMPKDTEPVSLNGTECSAPALEPSDADHLYSAKVMLLSSPKLEDIFSKCCGSADDSLDNSRSEQINYQHPTRLIQFLVGLKGKNEPMSIGGPWSPSLDGPNPAEDPKVLIKTAIRCTRALTNIDLSMCTQWYRFAEIRIVDLRRELEDRNLSSKGLKSQLIARLTKILKSEKEEEEELENNKAAAEEAVKKQEEFHKLEIEDKDDKRKKEEEEKRRREEKEQAMMERKYNLPDKPSIIVHPSTTAKGGKFDCTVMSLSVLLDYRQEDNKEHSFEVSLFAELFNEMLMRDFGFKIYKALVLAPEKKDEEKLKKKSDDKSIKEKDLKKIEEEKSEKKKEEENPKEMNGNEEDMEEDEPDDEDDDEDKKDRVGKRDRDEKKKEKKKFYTFDPALLLAFVYFDQNHTGYLLDKDIEEIMHTVGMQLSRAQVLAQG